MRITKDEAVILSLCLREMKYKLAENHNDLPMLFHALLYLEHRIDAEGEDKRRQGRTSQNDFRDILLRFVKTSEATYDYQTGRNLESIELTRKKSIRI